MISSYDYDNNKVFAFVTPDIAEVSDISGDDIVPNTTKVSSIDIKSFFDFNGTPLHFSHMANSDGTVTAWCEYPEFSNKDICVVYNRYDGLTSEFKKYGFIVDDSTPISNFIGESLNTIIVSN